MASLFVKRAVCYKSIFAMHQNSWLKKKTHMAKVVDKVLSRVQYLILIKLLEHWNIEVISFACEH